MADERQKLDGNGKWVAAVTNDASQDIKMLRVDPSTGRLLVDAAVTITDDTEHAEDSPFNNGDNGKLIFGVRQDSDTSPVSTDGDYHTLIFDNAGGLKVNVKTSALPSGAATGAKQDTGNTSLASIDTKTPALGQALAAASVPVVLTAAQITTLTPVSSVTADTELPSAAALSDALGNPTTPQIGADLLLWDSANSQWLRAQKAVHGTNSTGGGIQMGALVGEFDDTSPTSITENQFGNLRMSANRNLYGTIRDAAGNERGANVDGNNNLGVVLPAETTKVIGTIRNVGNVGGVFDAATAASVPANALYKGLRGTTALPTAVSDGQLVGGMGDKYGRHVMLGGTVRDLRATQTTTISASTSETTIISSGSSIFNDVVMLIFSNTSPTGTRIDIRDTTAGTILGSLYIPANDMRGFSIPTEAIPQSSVTTNWTAQCGTSVTDIRVYAVYDKNK